MNEHAKQSTDPALQQMMPQGFASRTKNEDGSEHFVTKGEHKFDRFTYGGVGYLANVGLSLGAVYWAERTHMGRNAMKGTIDRVQQWFPKMSEKAAQYIASKSLFLTGGFAVLVPMKYLEDHKIEKIKAYDREIYGDAVDSDPVLIKAHKDLEAAPKQSWSSIMGSRVLALIPFYATIGLPWSNKSQLSKWTNSEFRQASTQGKEAIMAMEKTNPSEFAHTMNKGLFVDKPLSWLSRAVGKGAAKITGNTQAIERIEQMQKHYPGMIKEGEVGTLDRDPNHSALPYYFVSEMITSAIVARGVYLLTGILAPIVGRKHAPSPSVNRAPPALPVAMPMEDKKVEERPAMPSAKVMANGLEHHATAAQQQLEAVR